jgi:phospholipase/carboxylesterase
MPRTRRSVPPYFCHTPNLDPPAEVDSALVSAGSLDFDHALFAPLHYEPGYAYPLIVWLHGLGNDERQLQRIMPLVSMRNYVALAVRGIRITDTVESERYGWLQTDEHIQQAEQRVFDGIELAGRKLHISSQRVFLAGFDGGGTMALRVAMSHPSRFAGVISFCGPFPTGRVSQDYPAPQVCKDLRLLHTAGLSVTLRQYPCGHELAPQMLADLDRWIIEQINPPAAPAVESDAEWSREAE